MRVVFSKVTTDALRYVNAQYLCKPMSDCSQVRDSYIDTGGAHVSYLNNNLVLQSGVVYRVNHGNAHNVRVTSRIRDIVVLCANPNRRLNTCFQQVSAYLKNIANSITLENYIIQLEVAASFYVACRESEIGWADSEALHLLYHHNSAKAFADYASTMQKEDGAAVFAKNELNFYHTVLEDPYFNYPSDLALLHNPETMALGIAKFILTYAHALDLARCFSPESLLEGDLFVPLIYDVNRPATEEEEKPLLALGELHLIKSEIQLILTGSRITSSFNTQTKAFERKGIPEKTRLFMAASLDLDITLRLIAISECVINVDEAHDIAEILNEAAIQDAIIDPDFTRQNHQILFAALSNVENKIQHQIDITKNYLLTAGPLPKSIYTAQFEYLVEKILENTDYDVKIFNDHVFLVFFLGETREVYNLTNIIEHTNFEHIQLGKNKSEFAIISAAYLRQTNHQPGITLSNFADLKTNVRLLLQDDIKKRLQTAFPNDHEQKYKLTVNKHKKILITYQGAQRLLSEFFKNTDVEEKIQLFESIYQKLSLAEMRSIRFYTSSIGHELLNMLLRSPVELFRKKALQKIPSGYFCNKDLQALINVIPHIGMLANALRKLGTVPAQAEANSNRAIRFINFYGTDFETPAQTHGVISEKGFVSAHDNASFNLYQSKVHSDFRGRDTLLEFKCVKGYWIALFSEFPGEREILMPPTQLQLLKIDKSAAKTVVEVSAVSDLRSYSPNSLKQYIDHRTTLASLNHLLLDPLFALFDSDKKHQEQKNAAVLFLGIYIDFDQQDVLNKTSMRFFLKLFDIIFHQYPSQTFQKRIQKQVDHLARYSQKFGFFFKKTAATNVISLTNLMQNQHQSKIQSCRISGLAKKTEGIYIPMEFLLGLKEAVCSIADQVDIHSAL